MKLYAISRWLGSFPSLGYAIFYLLLIPIFGGVYYFLPTHFYHSTIQNESKFNNTYKKIQEDVLTLIGKRFYNYNLESTITPLLPLRVAPTASDGEWEISLLDMRNIKIVENVVSVEIDIYAKQITNDQYQEKPHLKADKTLGNKNSSRNYFYPTLQVSFDLLEGMEHNESESFERRTLRTNFLTDEAVLHDDKNQIAIKKMLFVDGHFDGNYVGIDIPKEVIERAKNYVDGQKGIGSAIEGNFVRMIYLSAVTITTLGYGDIVPLTSLARILISLEAVLGIIVIGLFLNALSFERSKVDKYKNRKKRKNYEPRNTTNSYRNRRRGRLWANEISN